MYINYSNSGIKTLRAISVIYIIIHSILALTSVYAGYISKFDSGSFIFYGVAAILILNGLFGMALGFVFATIAEGALYQKYKIEDEEFRKD